MKHGEIYFGEIINNSREGNGVYIYGPDGDVFLILTKMLIIFIWVI